MNIRYLKATGMVQAKGKGIALVPEKRTLAIALTQELLSNKPIVELYQSLCIGTELPTDNATVAYQFFRRFATATTSIWHHLFHCRKAS